MLEKINYDLRDYLHVGTIVGPTNGIAMHCTGMGESARYSKIYKVKGEKKLYVISTLEEILGDEPEQIWDITMISEEALTQTRKSKKAILPPENPKAGQAIRIVSVGPYGARGVLFSPSQ